MGINIRDTFRTLRIYSLALRVFLFLKKVWHYIFINSFSKLLVRCVFFRKIYYVFFSNAFSDEIRLFAQSSHSYMSKKLHNQPNEFLLRRNIHRIEKGLIFTNRKSVFAKDYILETVIQYKHQAVQHPQSDLTKWGKDILNEYFNVVTHEHNIKKAYEAYRQLQLCEILSSNYKPVKGPALSNKYENMFSELALERKSVRDFKLDVVPTREQIDKAITIASNAPSSCNRQPFEFRIIDDYELVKKISLLPAGVNSFADKIRCMAIVIGKMDVSPTASDRHLMYIDASLASMNFMLSLQSQGIASCPINWPDSKKSNKALSKLISLKNNDKAILFIGFGFPKDNYMVACSTRKGLKEIRKYNQ